MNLGQRCRHIRFCVSGVRRENCKMVDTDQVCKGGKEGKKEEEEKEEMKTGKREKGKEGETLHSLIGYIQGEY